VVQVLIIDLDSWVTFASTIYFSGMLVSGVLAPVLGDKRGRRIALIVSIIIAAVSIIALGLSPNIAFACCCFFCAGVGFSGLEIVSLVYSTEISGKRFRNHSMVALNIVWAISQVILGFVYTFVSYWRYVFIGLIGVPCVLCLLATLYAIDETPGYLAINHRYEVYQF
jgi:MFS family permease